MSTRKRTDYLVVHVSATPPGWNKGAKGIDEMHKARGWKGIGYNEVINPDGSIEIGRGINAVGAHVEGFNSIAYGVCLVGGVNKAGQPDISTITPQQWTALENLLAKRAKQFPSAGICGHRDLSPDRDGDGFIEPHEHLKACPCFDAIPWAKSKGLPAANIHGDWDKSSTNPFPPVRPVAPDGRNVYLQKLLKRAGYEFGAIDGIVGPKTRAAIKRFQASAGFSQTGEFDAQTVRRLRDMFEAPVDKALEEQAKIEVAFQQHYAEALAGYDALKEKAQTVNHPTPAGGLQRFFEWLKSLFQ